MSSYYVFSVEDFYRCLLSTDLIIEIEDRPCLDRTCGESHVKILCLIQPK